MLRSAAVLCTIAVPPTRSPLLRLEPVNCTAPASAVAPYVVVTPSIVTPVSASLSTFNFAVPVILDV